MKLSNKTYDALKWVALVLLPAIQVLWLGLGKIWGFPYLVEIGASIACVDAFLGSLLGVSSVKYNAVNATQTNFNTESFEEMMGDYNEDKNGMSEE